VNREALKDQIERQMRMIEHLHELARPAKLQNATSGIRQSPLTRQVEALLEIGQSLVDDEVVPTPKPSRRRSRKRRYHRNRPVVVRQEPARDSAVSLNQRPRTTSRSSRTQRRSAESGNLHSSNDTSVSTQDTS
jgi:hypothetical protein